jgi:hypothetical protein
VRVHPGGCGPSTHMLAIFHAPNESVDPGEIERVAWSGARFLQEHAAKG